MHFICIKIRNLTGLSSSPQLSVFLHELAFSFGKISHKTSEDSSSFMIYSYTQTHTHILYFKISHFFKLVYDTKF